VAKALEESPKYKARDSYLFIRLSTILRSETQKKLVGSFKLPDKYNLLVIDFNIVKEKKRTQVFYKQLHKIIKSISSKRVTLIASENHSSAGIFKTGKHEA
jgi:hypothetical protein